MNHEHKFFDEEKTLTKSDLRHTKNHRLYNCMIELK